MKYLFLILSLVVISFAALGPYKVDPNTVSVGGLSSGAYMAVQFQVAFSKLVMGAAIFAGGPFYCAQDSLTDAVVYCMGAETPDVDSLVSQTKSFASAGNIDPTNNMARQKVYVYSGTMDFTVKTAVVQALVTYYQQFGISNIVSQFGITSGHGFPTLDYGVLCLLTMSPYLMSCNYDGAGTSLQTIYGTLKAKGTANATNILSFSQADFTNGSPSSISMGPTGYVYVPTACRNGAVCKLHINFHGCAQTINDINNVYYTQTGLNDWAESNNIIVLYPQAQDTSLTNPNGCWDWWGYTNSNYAFKSGPQMTAVRAMIKSIMGS